MRKVSRLPAFLLLLLSGTLAFLAADRLLPPAPPDGGPRYGYDDKGRLVRRTLPDGRFARHAYDAAGRLVRVSYHRPGRITGRPWKGGAPVRFTYDPLGNRTGVSDAGGDTRYAFDALGRPSSVTLPDGARLAYAYDPWGRVHAITYPDGTRATYDLDLFGQLARVSDGRREVHYRHDAHRVVRRLPNGLETTWRRAPSGRLLSIEHRDRGGTVLAAFRYAYDAAGRIAAVEETTPRGTSQIRYGYDLLGRLVQVDAPEGRTSFGYDELGNRVAAVGPRGTLRYAYDDEGRLVRAGDARLAYDAFGNLVSRTGGGNTVRYDYDAEGRLSAVAAEGKTVRYAYDGEGRRTSRTAGGQTTRYVHERFTALPRVLAESDERGTTRYLVGGAALAQTGSDGRTLYLLEDHLGSTRCVVDDDGRVVARYDYSPFGVPRLTEGSHATRFLFAGEEWDPGTGLIHLRARDYDPALGRFLTPDPVDGRPDDPQSYNLYAYARNDPVNRLDPTGLQPGWFPPPPPPPTYYDDRWRVRTDPLSWTNPGGLRPLPGSYHWSWYFPGVFLDAAMRGELLAPKYDHDHILRAILMFHPVTGWLVAGNDLSYNLSNRQYGDATLDVLLTAGLEWTQRRFPAYELAISRGDKIFSASMEMLESPYALRGAEWMGRQYAESHDPLDYLARFDPVVAGSLERTRNIFFPPPGGGGGGGGALPLVGGIYLDATARLIGELGTVTGAVYDARSGRLVLVGERRTALPPMRPEYLAAALRAVYTDSPHEPGMTIDPDPRDPHSPLMRVVFFGATENTRLGWVMFEADRVMKSYSVGRDNLTRAPVRSGVPGYRSVTAMGLDDPRENTGLWSRFWLVPEPVTARVSRDGSAIRLDPVRLRVKTETMRWGDGRLVPAAGVRDEHAEAFAAHFTANYDRYVAESPIYHELKQVTAAVALARWMKERGVPVDWNTLRILAGPPHPTPSTTPAAFAEEERSWTGGATVRTLRISTFGGVEMAPRLAPAAGREGDELRERVDAAWREAERAGQDAFPVRLGGREHHAVALPVGGRREAGSYSLTETDLPEAAARLGGLPGVARHYNSLHNEPGELGRSWSLLLPRLEFEDPGAESTGFLSVDGDPATQVRVQRFVLTNAFGVGQVRFREPFVDQELRRIGFRAEGSAAFRALYPEGEGLYRLFFVGGDQALFDAGGRLVAMLTPRSRALYDYDAAGRVTALRYSAGAAAVEVAYAYDGAGRLASLASGGERASYAYDRAGNLARVQGSGGAVDYRYDPRHLLTSVAIGGRPVVANRYDAAGRLAEQRGPSGARVRQSLEPQPDGGRLVRFEEGGRAGTRRYDERMRLTEEVSPSGVRRSYAYHGERLAAVDAALPAGGTARVELDPAGGVTMVRDPRDVRFELRYHAPGFPAELRVEGRPWAAYGYDAAGRLAEVRYEGGWSESFGWDAAGRLASYRRTTPGGAASGVTLARDDAGELVAVESAEGGRVEIARGPGLVQTSQGVGIAFGEGPEGRWLERFDGSVRERIESGARSLRRRDGAGGQTLLEFDAAGLVVSVRDALGGRASFEYDGARRLRTLRLPGGRCREYLYDDAGLPAGRRPCGTSSRTPPG